MEAIKATTYDNYKDSGVEWIGEIPGHWEIKKIKFVAYVYNGDSLNENLKKSFESFDKNHIPYISSKDIDVNNSNINYDNGIRIPKDNISLKVAPLFSSLLCIEGGSAGRKIAFTNQEVCFVNKLACFSINNDNDSQYLFFSLKGNPFQTQFKLSMSGMIGGVAISSINNFNIPIPPLPEQTAIAQFLDDKTTKIDQAIAIKKQQIALLKERKQILIHKAVTRGLNDKVTLKDSGVEWIGEIPEHWEVKKVTHLFNKIGSGTTPTSGENRYYDGNYNFLQTGDLNDGFIVKTKRTLKERAFKDFSSLKIYPKGSLVMAMYGATIGKLGILDIETATNQACCIFQKSKKINNNYFFQVLMAFREQIISFGYGGGQPNISQDLIKSLRFPIAPISEQKEIAAYIETASTKIDSAIGLKEQEIEKLQEYKSSLINNVVTGMVKVC